MPFQEFDTLEEAQAALAKMNAKPYGRRVAEEVYPGIEITDDVRNPNSPLGRKNPKSLHVQTDRAIDSRRIPGMSFQDYVKGYNDAGYDVLEAIDEYENPSPWATAPHWHIVLGDKKDLPPQFDTIEEAQAALAQQQGKPAPEMPVEAPQKVSPWENIPQGPRTAGAEQTVLTGREKAQNQDVENAIRQGVKEGIPFETVGAAIESKYPGQFSQNAAELKWYYDHYKMGGNTPMVFQAAKDRVEGPVGEEIVVTGQKKAPYQNELEFLRDNYLAANQRGFPGMAAREIVGALNPDLTDEQIAEAQRQLREEYDAAAGNHGITGVPGAVGGFAAGMLGGAGPEYLLPGAVGETALARILSGAGINAATDIAYQKADVLAGVQDQVDPIQVALSAGMGAAFQGGIEGLAKMLGRPVESGADGRYIETDEGRVYESQLPGLGGEPYTRTTPDRTTKADLLTGTALSGSAARSPEAIRRVDVTPETMKDPDAVEAQVSELTRDWVDPPEFNYHQKFEDLPDAQKLAIMRDTDGHPEDVVAWVDKNGKVNVILDHIDDPSKVPALVYHEALGHVGLSRLFGKDLNDILEEMYRTNPTLREETEQWFRDGGQIPDGVSPIARAAEEVLAERSEAGPITASTFDKIKNLIKKYARKAGIRWDFSDREINTILAMAHDKVINGGRSFSVGADGNRYVRVTHVSPHDFKNIDEDNPYGKFDHSKMGTGEGAQVYGWGTYLGENTRDAYYQKFSRQSHTGEILVDGKPIEEGFRDHLSNPLFGPVVHELQQRLSFAAKDGKALKTHLMEELYYVDRAIERESGVIAALETGTIPEDEVLMLRPYTPDKIAAEIGHRQRYLEEAQLSKIILEKLNKSSLEYRDLSPKTYEVELHPHQIERMMLWDKPLDQQSPLVQKAFEANGIKTISREEKEKLADARWRAIDEANFHFEDVLYPIEDKASKDVRATSLWQDAYDADIASGHARHWAINVADEAVHEAVLKKLKENPTWVEAKKKQVELEKAAQKAEEAYYAARPLTGESAYKLLAQKMALKEKVAANSRFSVIDGKEQASKALLREGVIGNKYEDGFSRGKDGSKSYNYVIFDENEAKIINKYMRKKRGTKKVEGGSPEEKARNFAGNINLDKLISKEDISAVIGLAARDIPKTRVTHGETVAAAREMGLTMRQASAYAATNGGARLLAMRQLLVRSSEDIMKLARSINDNGSDNITAALFARKMAAHRALQANLSREVADAARAVNAMKILADAGGDFEAVRMMAKKSGNEHLVDRDSIEATARLLVEHANSPEARNKILKDQMKPFWEDYVISFRYNMMLYGLGTHVKNALGNLGLMYTDFIEHGMAAALGKLRRGPVDKVTFREVTARQMGMIHALTSASTYAEAGKSFQQGRPTHQVSKVEVGHNLFSDALGAPGTAIDAPMKALAASDSFFRSILENSAYFGLAHRKAMMEGLRGEDYRSRVNELIADPTQDMKAMADEQAAILQLVDEPSALGKFIEDAKSRPANRKNYGKRFGRFLLHIAAPFTRVTDRLFWSAIRRVPIVGFLDKVNREDWAKGGAARDLVMARMAMGGLLISYLYSKAMSDELSGSGPAAYDKVAALQAEGWQPNSIKIGDEWVSLAGFDQISPLASLTAAFVDKTKDKEFLDENGIEQAFSLLGAAGNAFADNTFVGQLSDFFAMFGKSSMAANARENYAANTASSFLPAAVRQSAEISDGNIRDSSGDGTMSGKIVDRLKAGNPVTREDLPIRHDVYGREVKSNRNIFGVLQSREASKDPIVKEISRLSKIANKPLVTPVDRGDLSDLLGTKKVPSEIVQAYQKLSGEYIYASLEEYTSSPEWKTLTDEERIQLVGKITKAQRKFAREDLFEVVE